MRRKHNNPDNPGKKAGKVLEIFGTVLYITEAFGGMITGIFLGIEEEDFGIFLACLGGGLAGSFLTGYLIICFGILVQDVAAIREKLDDMGEHPDSPRCEDYKRPRHGNYRYDDELPDL